MDETLFLSILAMDAYHRNSTNLNADAVAFEVEGDVGLAELLELILRATTQ